MTITMNEKTEDLISTQLSDGVLQVSINNPPVNTLNLQVRNSILQAIESAQNNPDVKAILLVGAGNNFIAGADIKEFGAPPKKPFLKDVCIQIENSTKPVVAAMHGATFGGGLEIAMSAHYRVGLQTARFSLPEVTLGLIPGAGGTQRAPRLMQLDAALDFMLTGKIINAEKAKDLGLIDKVISQGNIQEAGISYAKELIEKNLPIRKTSDLATPDVDAIETKQALANARALLGSRYKGLFSPACVIDAVEAALNNNFTDGQAIERRLFSECLETPQRKALVHAFFAERKSTKIPGIDLSSTQPINKIAVIGGGTMGAGIAISLLDAGLNVIMLERDDDSLANGKANIDKVYSRLINRGRLDESTYKKCLELFKGTTSYQDLADVDLVIEAVFEDMEVKLQVFQELDKVCKPDTILASNTSYLDLNKIANSISRPENVIGLHFFSPANIMKLLEIVVQDKTAPKVIATGFLLAKKLRKIAVKASVCDGFIGNRILASYRQAADYLMADGATPYEIDKAILNFGFPMGPFQVNDLAGGDIGWATRKRKAATRDKRLRYIEVADRICERGWFGQKTGRGWYIYTEGSRVGQEDPEVIEILEQERIRLGSTARAISEQEIIKRYMAAMINEGANVLHENIAIRPSDIDVVMLNGYGFPRYKGGPMFYADQQGLESILEDINEFAKDDPFFWQASPLLIELVNKGKNFADLNQEI